MLRSLTGALALAACCALVSPSLRLAQAQEPAANATDPRLTVVPDSAVVGIGGAWKVGRWTPFRIDVEAARGVTVRMEIESIDPDGNTATFAQAPAELSPGRSTLRGRFQAGRLDAPLRVRFYAEGTPAPLIDLRWKVSERPADAGIAPPLLQSAVLMATVGKLSTAPPASAPATTAAPPPSPLASLHQGPLHVVALDDGSPLPIDVADYDGLDVLVLAGLPELPAAQFDAVRAWVRGGGHLVLAIGADAQRFAESPWQEWVPIRVTGASRLRELSGLEGFIARSSRITMPGSVPAAKIDRTDVDVRIAGLDGPLLVRAPYGFGRVTMLGVDIDRPPLSRWPGLGDFLRRMVLGTEVSGRESRNVATERIARQGLNDLATQLRSATDQFPEVSRSSSWTVLGLLIGYVLLLGPLDYLLVHRVLKRPQLTWITFPLLVVAVVFGAVWGADRTNGNTLRVNQVDVVDVDAATQQLRGQSWFSVYSPATCRYEVAGAPRTAAWSAIRTASAAANSGTPAAAPNAQTPANAENGSRLLLSWDGVPEEGFGGMNRRGGAGLARASYRIDVPHGEIENVPITVWSSKVVSARWTEPSGPLAESDLTSPVVGQLRGTFRHHLPGTVTDWVLAFGNRVYVPRSIGGRPPPVLPPGVSFNTGRPDVFQRELNGYLTGATSVRLQGKHAHQESIVTERQAWDPLNRDPLDLIRMVTFHSKADGAGYTGLANDGLRRLELSDLLELNRAVLFGRIEKPASEIAVRNQTDGPALDAELNQSTFVRIVFPVQQTGTVPSVLTDYNPNPVRPRTPPVQPPANTEPASDTDRPAEAELP